MRIATILMVWLAGAVVLGFLAPGDSLAQTMTAAAVAAFAIGGLAVYAVLQRRALVAKSRIYRLAGWLTLFGIVAFVARLSAQISADPTAHTLWPLSLAMVMLVATSGLILARIVSALVDG